MKTITMLEFRQNAPAIMRNLKRSGTVLITHRGKPAAKLSPPDEEGIGDLSDDPIYRLREIAEDGTQNDETMTNEKIDQILYGYGRTCDP